MKEDEKKIKARSIKKSIKVEEKTTVLQDLLKGGKGNVVDKKEE